VIITPAANPIIKTAKETGKEKITLIEYAPPYPNISLLHHDDE
jgi:hypothetical protein